MPDRVTAAIVTRWTAQSLGNTFTGGLYVDMAPRNSTYPYVILRVNEEAPRVYTHDLEIPIFKATFEVYYKESGSTDPVSALGTLMRTLTTAYDNAPLTFTGRTICCSGVRRGAQRFHLLDSDRRIWIGLTDYAITTQRSVTCNPS